MFKLISHDSFNEERDKKMKKYKNKRMKSIEEEGTIYIVNDKFGA